MENNKLIAEFMELETPDGIYFEYLNKMGQRIKPTHHMLLGYHIQWNWIMPVVEKIENLEYLGRKGRYNFNAINFEENYTCVVTDEGSPVIQVEGETRFLSIYNAVIAFLKANDMLINNVT